MSKPPSRLMRIRDEAARVLRANNGEPMHVSKIAAAVLPLLGLSEQEVGTKAINTGLHDDPSRRFKRVGRGTWTLHDGGTRSSP